MVSAEQMKFEVSDRVATITFDRPDKMNAWTPVMESELRRLMTIACEDGDVRAIVITGAGRGFCAGADMVRLSDASSGNAASAASVVCPDTDDDLAQRYSYLLAVPKPVIAGINGAIAGVGLCIALYCDLRYMAAGAKLTTSFARRGLIAEHGSAWMLRQLIGPMNAADLLLSGRVVEAAEAERLGLVRMLPADTFRETVQQTASDFANLCSPRSMRIIKQQLTAAPRQTLAEATQLANTEVAICREAEDFKEGVAHFVEKRAPRFTGK
ncbi:Enoyl-CoA hydratase/carnithine racemase [Bradyrhizobium yuanmingense]|uniref:Enoyl-CoA hydratase/carnithine racemase n=1 Tax=Bradyrhizobium yuanmingense TaxID=108015 RepID=A0A1C3VHV5_9BRAD|nr:enoyl-CoA hydratase-related protein [Bradyrhizobium yuanmingense]TWI28417.1 Enoyl-CoA hydratase [Bradyrhizobium yuanmingense]SCB27289.1 Enoyl-CoA hydratase/carnithine racemase [Bradyrhizobium yuanmingense]